MAILRVRLPEMIAVLRSFTLLRTAAGSLGLKIGAAGLGFLNSILLARLLGPAEFGVYSILLSVVNVAAMLAVLGLPMLVTRDTATNAEHGHWNCLKGIIDAANRWTLRAVLIILGGGGILGFGGFFKVGVPWNAILIVMALVPLIAFNQLRAAILRGLDWVVLADIPDLLLRPIVMLVLLVGIYFNLGRATADQALSIQLVAVGSALVLGTWWLLTKQPKSLKVAVSEMPRRDWLLGAMPFLAISIVGALEGQASLYLLGYLGGAEQAGLFQAAAQLVALIAMGLVAVNIPLQPKLAAAWSRGDKAHVQRLLGETARIGTIFAVFGTLLILIFAEEILRLYGTPYVEGSQALRILAIAQLVNAISGSCGILLLMTGYQRVVMYGTALALMLNVVVAYFSIPRYGVAGGALAAAFSMILWNFYFVAFALKKHGMNTTVFMSRPR